MTVWLSVSNAEESPQHKTCKCVACSGLSDEVMQLRFFLAPFLTTMAVPAAQGPSDISERDPLVMAGATLGYAQQLGTLQLAICDLTSRPISPGRLFGIPERTQGVFKFS